MRPGRAREVTINGETLTLVFDTGGDRIYIDESVIEKLGLRPLATRKFAYAQTGWKAVEESYAMADSVELDGVTVRNVPVHSFDLKSTIEGADVEIDGVLTTSFLKQFLSTVDYEKDEITLRERSESGKQQFLEAMAGTIG